jgi:hypothetical protein
MLEEIKKEEAESSRKSQIRIEEGKGGYKPRASNGIHFWQAENCEDKWAILPGYEELEE